MFCVIFGITILNWEIIGSGISVRHAKEEVVKAREEVLATKADIIFISSRTIELNDLVLDCTGRFGGCGQAKLSKIKDKRKELVKHLETLRENK